MNTPENKKVNDFADQWMVRAQDVPLVFAQLDRLLNQSPREITEHERNLVNLIVETLERDADKIDKQKDTYRKFTKEFREGYRSCIEDIKIILTQIETGTLYADQGTTDTTTTE